jgi:nucleotide-binding universal stress UspA family protein
MSQFETIIVAVDGSVQDSVAVPIALDEALRHNARLVLVYVSERPERQVERIGHNYTIANPSRCSREDTCRECTSAFAYLEQLRHTYHLFARVDLVVSRGDPVRQIELEAQERARPLVIMANISGPGGAVGEYLQQERATRLLIRGQCALMVVNQALEPVAKSTLDEERTVWKLPRELATA